MSNITKNSPTTTPIFLKNSLLGNKTITATLSSLTASNIESTSSFRFDPNGSSLKSTQQLNVDWSQFENHCFFMSAEALVNITFDKIINTYPFDGTKKEIEAFFDDLTGYERWVFDQIPKFKGALQFSGSWISVNDKEGFLFPELAKNKSGISVISPEDTTFSIELLLNLAEQANDNQIICQKLNTSSNTGFSLFVSSSASTDNAKVCFSVVSGSVNSYVDCVVTKGSYNHIVATLDCSNSVATALMYNNLELQSTGNSNSKFSLFQINEKPFLIGSGTSWRAGLATIEPKQTLSGSIDEFRFFHSKRSIYEQTLFHNKSITSEDNLKLYFKFNEPPTQLVADVSSDLNAIVLDSSGHGLHSIIINYTSSLRLNNESNMLFENDDLSPILFPAYSGLVQLNTELLTSASKYDNENPNLITKLIPEHWILQGQSYEGFENQYGNINNTYGGDGIPGQGTLGSTHMILSFLYMYARQFDETKLFHDHFGSINNVSYDEYETTPNLFLHDISKESGIELPSLFNESSIEQYVYAENIDNEVSTNLLPLRSVQDELTKRVLVNFPKIIRSKGTIYAIESFLRSFGIDVGNSVKVREYGGEKTKRSLSTANETKFEYSPILRLTTASLITSPFLTSPRVEPGLPKISGNATNDCLLTSGSWSFEGFYKWTKNIQIPTTQSLCRFYVSGTTNSLPSLVANLTVMSSSDGTTTFNLYAKPNTSSQTYDHVILPLSDGNSIFDGENWHISFGFEQSENENSGSYFIRTGFYNNSVLQTYTTTSFIEIVPTGSINVFREKSTSLNTSGSFFRVGGSTGEFSTTSSFLNTNTYPDVVRTQKFDGYVSNIRFWSKALTISDFKTHVKNYKSVGTSDPRVNFDFNTIESGTFERLRMNVTLKQDDTTPQSGELTLYDQTSNGFDLSCVGLDTTPFVSQMFECNQLSTSYDESINAENIKIRGAQSLDIVEENDWTDWAPVYKTPEYEEVNNNLRLSIDFSLIDSLNKDIVTLFTTLEKIGDSIGSTESMFSHGYRYIESVRDIYFQQIRENINFKKFFDFFQWFDTSIGTFIEQLLPYKTNFKGVNFVVESHMLERHKLVYRTENNYLFENNKFYKDDSLLLQQIVGVISKY